MENFALHRKMEMTTSRGDTSVYSTSPITRCWHSQTIWCLTILRASQRVPVQSALHISAGLIDGSFLSNIAHTTRYVTDGPVLLPFSYHKPGLYLIYAYLCTPLLSTYKYSVVPRITAVFLTFSPRIEVSFTRSLIRAPCADTDLTR